jgi:SanA protein
MVHLVKRLKLDRFLPPQRWSLRRISRVQRVLIVMLIVLILALAGTVGLRGVTALQARGSIYSLVNVPDRPVAIVFGAQVFANGQPSAMLADRIKMAAALYQAGKVKALLLTGDNHIASYNEPEVMRQYALTLGVPDSALVLDYAGFRTYDSCYRARDVFKISSAILVSQAYHLDRAILICQSLGIDSAGVAADAMRPTGYAFNSLLTGELREIPATMLSVIDLLRGKKPTYLGDPLPIFG